MGEGRLVLTLAGNPMSFFCIDSGVFERNARPQIDCDHVPCRLGRLLPLQRYDFLPLVRSMSKRFLPNSRASTDQAPGPSMARLNDRTARRTCTSGVLGGSRENATHSSVSAAAVAVTGVHKPASRNMPLIIAKTCCAIAVAANGFPESQTAVA